ncbi:MAG TPA: PCRF domain-containing protein, partial [bacterium]|nr:PCRF domain-containing protein [bacterium]
MTINQDMIRKLETLESRYNEIVDTLSESGVSGDPEKLKKLGKALNELDEPARLFRKHNELNIELTRNTALFDSETDRDMKALYKDETDRIKTDIIEMETAIVKFFNPSDEEEDKQFIIEIRAGTGGSEAGLFAGDLFRMYLKYAEIKGWKFESINESPTPLGGFKEVMFSMRGTGALARLRYESGVHRVQRIPV